jgi:hypothetical protein
MAKQKPQTKKFSELRIDADFRLNGKDYRKIQPQPRLWDVSPNALCLENNKHTVIDDDTVVFLLFLNEHGDLDYVFEEEKLEEAAPMKFLPFPLPETKTNWPKPISEKQLHVEDVYEDRNVE